MPPAWRARPGKVRTLLNCGAPLLPPLHYILLNRGKTEVLPVLPLTEPLQMILQSEFFTDSHQGTLEEFLK